jgi:hypothetical protein
VVAWGILAGTACAKGAPASGLEVIIATNLKDPSEYDGMTIDVSQGSDAGAFRSVFAKTYAGAQLKLPGTVAISPGRSPDETALIVVTATKGGKPVVVETRETTIPETRVAELVIVLSSKCAYVTCPSPAQTCQASTGTCGSSAVSSATLPPYDPADVDHVDAGPLDATIAEDAPREGGRPGRTDGRASDAGDGGDARDLHPDAGPCPTYYVSTTGSDSNDGCSPSAPLLTIATATQRASTVTGVVPTVEVCAGTYPETELTITSPMVLNGGYDCTSWTRPLDLGYASFGGASLTVIQNAPGWTRGSTLELKMGSGASVVNGFTIEAATSSPSGLVGPTTVTSVSCLGPATPTLSSDVMTPGALGGWSVGENVTSDGVYLGNQTAATITNSSVSAGVGTGVNSSAGVYVDGTSTVTSFTGDVIAGGGGPGNSFGVNMQPGTSDAGTLASTLQGCTITGGTGSASYGFYALGERGVTLASSAVELTPRGTDGGTTSCGIVVDVQGAVSAVVTGNRIFAEPCDHANASGLGLAMVNVGSASIYNNMISGGIMSHAGGATAAVAVHLDNVTSPDIRFNTLVGGVSVNGATASGYSAALNLIGVTGAVISDNILAGEAAGDSGVAIRGVCAPAGTVAAFENNVLFNTPYALLRYECPMPFVTYTGLNEALTALGVPSATGNLVFGASCDPDAGPCVMNAACGNPEACLAQMFSGWNKGKDGIPSLASFVDAGCDAQAGNGWTLAATAPCQVVQGGAADAGVTADIYGAACRSAATTSMGAAQGGACAP